MPRKPSPRYFPSLRGFYTQIDGTRYLLAKGEENDPQVKAEAETEFRRLMYMSSIKTDKDRATVFQVANHYIQHQEKSAEENSVLIAKKMLGALVQTFAETKVADLNEDILRTWLDEKRTWGPSTRRMLLAQLKAAINHAIHTKILSKSPFPARMKLPTAGTNSTNELITDEHHRMLIEELSRRRKSRDFLLLLELLKVTGARPAELYRATATEWKEATGQLVIRPQRGRGYKNARHGKLRIINIPENMVWAIKELVNRHPQGPLFLTEKGTSFSNGSVSWRFARVRKVVNTKVVKQGGNPIPECVTLYSYRHAFATNWLIAGLSPHDLCHLIGTSMVMLERHYSHVMQNQQHLRKQLERFMGQAGVTEKAEAVIIPVKTEAV